MSVWTFRLIEPLVLYHGTGKLHRPHCAALRQGSSFAKDYEWFDDGTEVSTEDPYDVLDRHCGRCDSRGAIERLSFRHESMVGTHWERP